jgi:hypothetical protein
VNGETMLVYTTREGGYFKPLLDEVGNVRFFSQEEYEEVVRTGVLRWMDVPSRHEVEGHPKLIMLVRIEANHDFILGSSREEARDAVA